MASDYREHLDEAALGLLAETTGFASRSDAPHFFRSRPHDISVALGSPEAASLLAPHDQHGSGDQNQLLQLAIAVHRTAEEICQAGWTASEYSHVDMGLLKFSGQTDHQRFVVGLLASFLSAPPPVEAPVESAVAHPGTVERLLALVDLCSKVGETERAGALRLLGDEALFSAGIFPEISHRHVVGDELIESLHSVLPRAVVLVLDDLRPELVTLLDIHLMFGPVWYRMGAQDLVHTGGREALNNIATDFSSARRFLVRIAQGPLAQLRLGLYPEVS